MRGRGVIRAVGYPDEMQAREAMILEFERLGSKAKFCEAVGLSSRYVSLIMEWKRAPVHWRLMQYFGWTAVYVDREELTNPRPRNKPGSKPRQVAIDPDERRAYLAAETERMS